MGNIEIWHGHIKELFVIKKEDKCEQIKRSSFWKILKANNINLKGSRDSEFEPSLSRIVLKKMKG